MFYTNLDFFSFSLSFNRGFGFVTFSDAASVDKVLMNGPHELDGKKVSVQALIAFAALQIINLPPFFWFC